MLAPLAQQLGSAGFIHYAIGHMADASQDALVLLYHPDGGRDFDTRQALLEQETGLELSLHTEVPEDDDDDRHFQEVRSSHYDQGWGKSRFISGPPGASHAWCLF